MHASRPKLELANSSFGTSAGALRCPDLRSVPSPTAWTTRRASADKRVQAGTSASVTTVTAMRTQTGVQLLHSGGRKGWTVGCEEYAVRVNTSGPLARGVAGVSRWETSNAGVRKGPRTCLDTSMRLAESTFAHFAKFRNRFTHRLGESMVGNSEGCSELLTWGTGCASPPARSIHRYLE